MYLEYTFFYKIVYSRYTKYHHGLPCRLKWPKTAKVVRHLMMIDATYRA